MKKCVFLLVMSLFVFVPTWSQDSGDSEWAGTPDEPQGSEIDGLVYFFSSEYGAAYLRRDNSWDGELVIPAEVEYGGVTYTVIGISRKAFRNCQTLTKVTIPKTLIYLVYWGGYADFTPQNVPFVGCTALESIEVDKDNPQFCSVDGVMFTKDKADLVCYPAGSKRKTYTVPDGAESVYADAFAYNPYLESVIFPNTISSMYPCFKGCTALESVTLSKKLSILPSGLFSGCTKLKSIEIPTSVTEVKAYAFEDCSSLTTIELPKSVTQLGYFVFRGCSSLKTLIIRGNIEEVSSRNVNEQRFGTIPEQVTIYCQPEQVETIQMYFSGTVLPLDMYQPDAESVSAKEYTDPATKVVYTYDTNGTTATVKAGYDMPSDFNDLEGEIEYYPGSPEASGDIAILDKFSVDGKEYTVTNIGLRAFCNNKNITSVIIPKTVTSIQYMLFEGCRNLTSIISYIEEPFDCEQFDYLGLYDRATLYVPKGCKEKYEATDGWKQFKKIEEMETMGICDAPRLNDKGKMINDKRGGVYDLQGRRLTLKPENGVYIENGRKRVVK